MDYRIYCLITVLAWGVWGFGAKMVAERLPGGVAPLLTGATSVLCIACYVLYRRSSIPLKVKKAKSHQRIERMKRTRMKRNQLNPLTILGFFRGVIPS